MRKRKLPARQIEIRTYTAENGMIQGLMMEAITDHNVATLGRNIKDRQKIVDRWEQDTKAEQTRLALIKLGWLPPEDVMRVAISMDKAHSNFDTPMGAEHLEDAMEALRSGMEVEEGAEAMAE